jgi:cytolysin-activating lysine-acyltransferase
MSEQNDQTQQIAAWNAAIVGVLALLARSPVHRTWSIADTERLILPPLALGQCLLIWDQGRVVAFASYARLTEEAEAGYLDGSRKLQPGDWNAGDRIWLVDVIAPYGHARSATSGIRALARSHGHAGKTVSFKRINTTGKPRRIARVKI